MLNLMSVDPTLMRPEEAGAGTSDQRIWQRLLIQPV
jgi:hypothetical protein